MKISFSMPPNDLQDRKNGFSTAGFGIVTSLQQLGHEVPFRDISAPVTFNFCHPPYAEWGNNYNIIMPAWESTKLPEDWVEHLEEADEVWAPSHFVKNVLEYHGVKVERVYPHGVDPLWKPVRRERGRVLKFLHVGEPAPRKGAQMAYEAFREVFGDRKDVQLTIKSAGRSMVWANKERRVPPDRMHDNVKVIRQSLSVEGLYNLHLEHHAMIYPSWGEGFGLIPLQAMASGMPTAVPWVWSEYDYLVHPDLRVYVDDLVDSPWPGIHPGKMFKPSYDHLLKIYRLLDEDYNYFAERCAAVAEDVHCDYSWVELTREAFKDVVEKFS